MVLIYTSAHHSIRQQSFIGDFTEELDEVLGRNVLTEKDYIPKELPKLHIDGPFSAPTENVLIMKLQFWSVMVLVYQHKNNRLSKLRCVEFFWIYHDTGSFEWFQSLLKTLEVTQLEEEFLKFHIYLTLKLPKSTIQNIVINNGSSFYDPLTDL
ncbi:NADPH oxidase [Rhizophagus clarus]|uniref:NADPH oxidase n=1 Tax=Rhizophagus clarus TaxID=94130 RepID=A0A8H3LJ06_9GLOM|nr:NADPH oxidase [Rhizophagus clarus]